MPCNEPINVFVAGFLGSSPMNFISGTLKADSHKIRFRDIEGHDRGGFRPSRSPGSARVYRQKCHPGNSPGRFGGGEVQPQRRESASARISAIAAIIDIVEPVGAETNLYLQTGAHTLVCRSQGALDHREAAHRFQIEMNLERTHLFDPISTNRLH